MSICSRGFAWRLAVCIWLLACPALAQESSGDLQFNVAGGISGMGVYRQGVWAPVRSEVINPTAADREPLVVASVKAEPWLQFASRAWTPAGSRRLVSTMLCWTSDVPVPVDSKPSSIELDMLLIDDAARTERVVDREISLLPTRNPSHSMALYSSGENEAVRDFFELVCTTSDLGGMVHPVGRNRAPTQPEAWAPIAAAAVAAPLDQLESPQAEAMRRWLWTGGRLWLMLDQVDAQTPAMLLGSDWTAAEIDRISVASGQFASIQSEKPMGRIDLDYPEPMVRVALLDDAKAQVLFTVDGYPAAWWQTVGQGQLLVTTLGPAAWQDSDPDVLRRIGQFLNKGLGGGPLQRSEPVTAAIDPMAQYVTQQVGHEVLGIAPAAALLGLMTFGLLGGGLLLMRQGRLEWSAGLALGLVVVSSLALILIGRAKQANTPGVVAITSTLNTQPTAGVAKTTTFVQVYRPPGSSADVSFAAAGPLPTIDRNQIIGRGQLRFIQTDRDRWYFQNLDLAPGVVRTLQLNGSTELPSDLRVQGTFDETGLVLTASLPDGAALSDPLIVTPSGLLAPQRRPDGRLAAGPDDEVSVEAPLRSAMLSQRQIQRQAVYRAVLSGPHTASEPALMGWLADAPVTITIDGDDIPHREDTLASLPIRMVAPEPGQKLTVPPALLGVSAFRDPSLGVSSTIYDEVNKQFITGITTGQAVALRFSLPEAVVKMRPESVDVTLDLVCPQREYEVIVYDGRQMRAVLSDRGLMGRRTISLSGEDLPTIVNGGQLIVGVRVKDAPPGQTPASWSLNELMITPTGVMPTKRSDL